MDAPLSSHIGAAAPAVRETSDTITTAAQEQAQVIQRRVAERNVIFGCAAESYRVSRV
jgi:hypothetical protein